MKIPEFYCIIDIPIFLGRCINFVVKMGIIQVDLQIAQPSN